jgi:hypothetical protein
MSSGVGGWTPGVRELPDDIGTQLDDVFTHISNILKERVNSFLPPRVVHAA